MAQSIFVWRNKAMPLHETFLFSINIPDEDKAIPRENKLRLADTVLANTVLFINHVIEKNKLNLPKFPASFDPSHASRWLYFFLRETIRNSVDAFFAQEKPPTTSEIKITVTMQTKAGQLYLKVKDNGPGFTGVDKGITFTKEPTKALKDTYTCIGGKGFGLSICQEKLSWILYKNRKISGASVQTSFGSESSLGLVL